MAWLKYFEIYYFPHMNNNKQTKINCEGNTVRVNGGITDLELHFSNHLDSPQISCVMRYHFNGHHDT